MVCRMAESNPQIFGIPYRTHCDLLPVFAGYNHIETQLLCRLVKFVNGAISRPNVQLNALMNVAINGSLSHMSDNINHMLSTAKSIRHMVKSYDVNYILDIVSTNVNIDKYYSTFLSIDELNSILDIICI